MLGGLLKSFPEGFTPNSAQVKLLKNIDQAFSDGYKFVVCNAPTGSGKSFISKTLANSSDVPSENFKDLITSYTAFKIDQTGSYTHEDECEDEDAAGTFALTITKALQDQYKELFNKPPNTLYYTIAFSEGNIYTRLSYSFDFEELSRNFTIVICDLGIKELKW